MTTTLPIATATSRYATRWHNQYLTKQDLTARIYDPHTLDYTTQEWQHLTPDQRAKTKDHGGYVGGHLKNGQRRKGNTLNRSIITLDIDNPPTSLNLPDHLHNTLDYAWLAHTTASHTPQTPRWRLIIWLTHPTTGDQYEAIARKIAHTINPTLDWFDSSTYQPERLMYWPVTTLDGDYQAHISHRKPDLNPDTILAQYTDWRDITTWPGITLHDIDQHHRQAAHATRGGYDDPRDKPGWIGAFNQAWPIDQLIPAHLADVYTPGTQQGRYTYTKGTSTNGLVLYDGGLTAYSMHSTDPAAGVRLTAFDLMRIHKYGHLDTDTPTGTPIGKLPSTKAMEDYAQHDPATIKANFATTAARINQAFKPIDDDGDGGDDGVGEAREDAEDLESATGVDTTWLDTMDTTKSGQFKETLNNFVLIFTHDPRYNHIAWNAHTNALAVTDPAKLPWKQIKPGWTDNDLAQLKQAIAADYGGLYSPTKMQDALISTASARAFHPVRDYFNELLPWDETPRLDTLLIDTLGAADTNYTRAVTRKTLVAAYRRTFHPGTKFDTVLTLVGPQGIGKSTIFAKLAGQWFSDNLTLTDMRDKTGAEKLAGNLIVEISELAGLKKTENEVVKSFISRTEDKYRPAYGRTVQTYKRECILTATTNAQDGFLKDPTGNRRWWAVPVTGEGKTKAFDLDQPTIDQIWAETKHYAEAGEPLYLEGEAAAAAHAAQTEAAETDDRTGIVAEYLAKKLPKNWGAVPLEARRVYLATGSLPSDHAQHDTWAEYVERDSVSRIEIWAECFGRDPDAMKRSDSYDVSSILSQIGGWEATGISKRLPIYGKQRVFTREP